MVRMGMGEGDAHYPSHCRATLGFLDRMPERFFYWPQRNLRNRRWRLGTCRANRSAPAQRHRSLFVFRAPAEFTGPARIDDTDALSSIYVSGLNVFRRSI